MSGVNKVILLGNLGKDPEIRYLEGNIAKTRFNLATTEIYKDKNGNKAEHTEWHHIVMWRSLAENASRILKKGMQVYIEGKLHTNTWTDKDGHKKNITEIVADNFLLLQRRDNHQQGPKEGFPSSADSLSDSGGLPY